MANKIAISGAAESPDLSLASPNLPILTADVIGPNL
jgi:hypothetical protein